MGSNGAMQARDFIDQLVRENPAATLINILNGQPDLAEKLPRLPGGLRWQACTQDGWYLLARPYGWEFFYQERGSAIWGETFRTFAEAVAWTYEERWL